MNDSASGALDDPAPGSVFEIEWLHGIEPSTCAPAAARPIVVPAGPERPFGNTFQIAHQVTPS